MSRTYVLKGGIKMKDDTITIQIDKEDLKILKNAEYYLCMAGRIKDADFTVVWYATESYTSNNQIQINNKYEVFASNGCTEKVSVDFSGVPVDIGEKCVIDKYGIISQAKTGEISDAIVLVNEFGNLYPGLMRRGRGINGEEFYNPLFLSPNLILPGEFDFVPVYQIKIWFAQNVETGKILPQEKKQNMKSAKTNYILVDLEKRDTPVLSYSNGEWRYI